MSSKSISLWEIEMFLVANLREVLEDGSYKIEAKGSLTEFIGKLEKYINNE